MAGMKEIKILIPDELFGLFVAGEALGHLRAARREMLLAVRAVIDAKIAAMDKKAARPSDRGKRKIKVE